MIREYGRILVLSLRTVDAVMSLQACVRTSSVLSVRGQRDKLQEECTSSDKDKAKKKDEFAGNTVAHSSTRGKPSLGAQDNAAKLPRPCPGHSRAEAPIPCSLELGLHPPYVVPLFLPHVIVESSTKSHEILYLVARGLPLNHHA